MNEPGAGLKRKVLINMTVWRLSSGPNDMLGIGNIRRRDGAADCQPGDACHSRAPPRRQCWRIPHQPVAALLARQHRPGGHFIAADDFYVFDEGEQEMGEPRVPAPKHRAPDR
jgi:hypothetical protein